MLLVIIYDIVDNKRRLKLAKVLKGYGIRVQKSAFEAYLDRKKREALLKELSTLVGEKDSIRIYLLDREREVITYGEETDWENQEVLII